MFTSVTSAEISTTNPFGNLQRSEILAVFGSAMQQNFLEFVKKKQLKLTVFCSNAQRNFLELANKN
jgi:hypothetical protein